MEKNLLSLIVMLGFLLVFSSCKISNISNDPSLSLLTVQTKKLIKWCQLYQYQMAEKEKLPQK
ncbi:MAG: hypothetical protein WCQ47_09200 [bacterium]